MIPTPPQFLTRRQAFADPVLWVIGLLGIASGLPLALTAATLGTWLKDEGISKTSIGLFAAVGTPYALKFLWAPLMDGLRLPLLGAWLGRRRSWLLVAQLLIVLGLALLAFVDPRTTPLSLAGLALFVAVASSTQDIVIDAYRTERLTPAQLGAGITLTTLGYRIGMLVSGAGALMLASRFGWPVTYLCMAGFMAAFLPLTLLIAEPEIREIEPRVAGHWLRDYVVAPFADFARQPGWWVILLFILTYKLGDAFLGVMTNPFLLEIGFSKDEIASIVKLFGTGATIAGTLAIAFCTMRFRLITLLWAMGLLHALTNAMFLLQAHMGANAHILAAGIALENFTGAISSGVFVVFISRLCHARYTATQYALLSALAAFGRTNLSTGAGWVADAFGWEPFFAICILLALPSLGILWWLNRKGFLASSFSELPEGEATT